MQLFWPRRVLRAAPALRRVATAFDAWVVNILWWVGSTLGPERSTRLFRRAFRWLGPLHAKADKVTENLRIAFPERGAGEIRALAREVWAESGALISEYTNLPQLVAEAVERTEFAVHGDITTLRDPERPAIFVTAHYGAWELSLLLPGHYGVPLTAMYNFDFLHSNPQVARRVEASRAALPCELIPRQSGVRPLVRALGSGRSVGLVVDYRFDQCELIPFFHREAYTTTLPARLALRYGCDLVPVRVDRAEPGRYRITAYPPVRPDRPGDPPREQALQMTAKINRHFEAWIRERPGQWFCLKRRWPKQGAAETRPEPARVAQSA